MVLETPLLRVSRPVAACSRCRAAKVKCDGKLPACSACEKSGRAAECSSTNDQFARGKERSYVATLETRIEKLEKKIAEARARRKSSTVVMQDYSENATARKTSVDTLKPPNHMTQRAARRKERDHIEDLVSGFGLLVLNATARDFYGFNSIMTYSRLILAASSKEALPTGLTKALPPKYAATPLVQHYLNNLFTLLPLFEEAAFYRSFDAMYYIDSPATPFDHWTVRMVLAISCLSQSEQRGDTLYSDAIGHVNAALEHAEAVLHPGSIASIQALILLVEYAMMDPHHFDSWTLIGAASRLVVDLGIHQDPSRSTSISKVKLEARRRVYWCVYALDRSTSLVQTRAFSFSDDSANVAFPFRNMVPNSPKASSPTHVFQQSFDGAISLFKLREIQSEWYMDLFQSGREPWNDPYPYIWNTYSKMSRWFDDMSANTLPSTKAFFELELLYSYVYILSPSPRIPRIQEYAQRLIFEHCITYANGLLALITSPSSTIKPPITFYDAMRAYMTGRQFVDVLSRNPNALLSPVPPAPPPSSAPEASEDPLSPPIASLPPPFPQPSQSPLPDGQPAPQDPVTRAINAINSFTEILSLFGLRFGFTHWRDRFQRESSPILSQLYARASTPTQSPHGVVVTPPVFPVQSWHPNAGSPHQQQQQGYFPSPSATSPPGVYPSQPSPFSGSTYSQDSGAYVPQAAEQQHGHGRQWSGNPSPQPVPELPQPSEGRQRHAIVLGPGLPVPAHRRGGSGENSSGR